jgi:hypothetical protein
MLTYKNSYCVSNTVYPPKSWLVCDKPIKSIYFSSEEEKSYNHKGLLFHIEKDDYFRTLITILGFYKESVYDKNLSPKMRYLQFKIIKEIIKDLKYLDKNYTIKQKFEEKKDITDSTDEKDKK